MAYAKRIVLICNEGCSDELGEFVEACLRDGVGIVCASGPRARHIEEILDEYIVGDGSDRSRFINTSGDESLDDAMHLARHFFLEDQEDPADQPVQVITLE